MIFQKIYKSAIVNYGRLSPRYLACDMPGLNHINGLNRSLNPGISLATCRVLCSSEVFLISKEIVIRSAIGMLKVADLIFSVQSLTFGKNLLCRALRQVRCSVSHDSGDSLNNRKNSKIYMLERIPIFSNLRIVSMIPGDRNLLVAGRFYFSVSWRQFLIFTDCGFFGLIKKHFEKDGKIYISPAVSNSCLTPRYLACGFPLVTCRAYIFLRKCFSISNWLKRLECFQKRKIHKSLMFPSLHSVPRYLACGFIRACNMPGVFYFFGGVFPLEKPLFVDASNWYKRLGHFLKKWFGHGIRHGCLAFSLKIPASFFGCFSLCSARANSGRERLTNVSEEKLNMIFGKNQNLYKPLMFPLTYLTPRYLACGFSLVTCRAYFISLEVFSH